MQCHEQVRWGVANTHQFLAQLGTLALEAAACGERVAALDRRLLGQMAGLQGAIGGSAQPWASVCPLFTAVAATWSGLQDEMVVLSNINSLTGALHGHTRCLARLPLARLTPLLEPLAVLTEEQRQEAAARKDIDSSALHCELIYPGAVQRYDQLVPELAGFCPVALLSGAGFLLAGSPRLGTLRWKGKLYTCSTADRAEQFGADPDLFLAGVAGLVARRPVLGPLLRWQKEPAGRAEAASQTDLHPVESLVDPRYQWNEWELRREALATAGAEGRSTTGCQAGPGRGAASQTGGGRATAACQTVTDACVATSTAGGPGEEVLVTVRSRGEAAGTHTLESIQLRELLDTI
jgi:hypothetical protein